eukprot:UN27545
MVFKTLKNITIKKNCQHIEPHRAQKPTYPNISRRKRIHPRIEKSNIHLRMEKSYNALKIIKPHKPSSMEDSHRTLRIGKHVPHVHFLN